MNLSYRPANADELDNFFYCFADSLAYSASIRPHVPRLWQHFLSQGLLLTQVFEDWSRPNGKRVLGLSAAVFIHDDFVAEIEGQAYPCVREELLQREVDGQSVVLNWPAMQQANARQGLNLFFLNSPLANPQLSQQEVFKLYDGWGEALFEYRACNLRSIVWECDGDDQRRLAEHCGMSLKMHSAEAKPTSLGQQPYLMSITRSEALARYGSHVWYLFNHQPAQFAFTVGQQSMLKRALSGETDEELAQSLYLSLSGVKKRWFAIYDRVSLIQPELLPLEPIPSRQTRGSEKRRHLLHYLRMHPEELHPINAGGN